MIADKVKKAIKTLLSEPVRGSEVIVFDTETHHKENPRLIESAYAYINKNTGSLLKETLKNERFNPGVPISFGAMAAHHIIPEEIEGCPPSEDFSLPDDVGYVLGQNIVFDMDVIGNPKGVRLIDTLPLARKAWPNADSYTQSALYYMLSHEKGLDLKKARDFIRNAHSAAIDIEMCSFIFDSLLEIYAPLREKLSYAYGDHLSIFESMYLISEASRVPDVMGFGKHKGLAIENVPRNYVDWYIRQDETDPWIVLALTGGGAKDSERAVFTISKFLFSEPWREKEDNSPKKPRQMALF